MQIEKSVNEVEQFYSATGNTQLSKGSSILKDKEKYFSNFKQQQQQQQQQDASQREAAAARRMQELMRQFATILRQANTSSFLIVFARQGFYLGIWAQAATHIFEQGKKKKST